MKRTSEYDCYNCKHHSELVIQTKRCPMILGCCDLKECDYEPKGESDETDKQMS